MKNTIYWFSGTGNSLFAARVLAEELEDSTLVPMAKHGPSTEPIGGDGHRIGFVFPSYYGNLPRLVRSFVESLNMLPDSDLFCVVTMGAFGRGSIKALEELLADKGQKLRFGFGVMMPPNYILSYDPALFGARSGRRIERKLTKAKRRILSAVGDIAAGTGKVKSSSLTTKTLYTDVALLDAGFAVTEKCVACGSCERMCPVGNIRLVKGKPEWQHHCERCIACISWCPTAAIEYGEVTQSRTRYQNPHISASEIVQGSAKENADQVP
jgi:ferredoxin